MCRLSVSYCSTAGSISLTGSDRRAGCGEGEGEGEGEGGGGIPGKGFSTAAELDSAGFGGGPPPKGALGPNGLRPRPRNIGIGSSVNYFDLKKGREQTFSRLHGLIR